MPKAWRLIGHYDAETQAYSACAGAAQASPYTPDFDGTLTGIRTIVSRTAATSLTNHVQIRLSCTKFNPNNLEVGAQGSGLQTAPAIQAPPIEWPLNQPVVAGVPITVEGRCIDANQVTNEVLIYGHFEVK